MNKAQYVISLSEEMIEEMSAKKAAIGTAAATAGAYGIGKGLQAAGKVVKSAIEGGHAGKVVAKAKEGMKTAKEIAGK